MRQFVVNHWGSIASVLGLFVALVSIGFTVWRGRRARAAEQKAKHVAEESERHWRAVNLERALSLIRQIRILHRSESWDESLNQYQTLRTVIVDIAAGFPANVVEERQKLTIARHLVGQIETDIHEFDNYEPTKLAKTRLIRRLNDVQEDLESLASDRRFSSPQKEAT